MKIAKLFTSAALGLLVAVLGVVTVSPTVSAEAAVGVYEFENLSTMSPTTVTVSGNGLEPNSSFVIRQESFYKPTSTITAIERAHKAVVTTDANGEFSVQISVQYDVRPDQPGANYCDNDVSLGRLCHLHLQYQTDTNTSVIGQYKLYFGVPAPVADTTGPVIVINEPADGATYAVGEFVVADYSCVDNSGISLCEGNEDLNGSLYTATPGTYTFTVNAVDGVGNTSSLSRTYTVKQEVVPPVSPLNRDDCKVNGWQLYVDANGTPFKNQGDCVKHVNN